LGIRRLRVVRLRISHLRQLAPRRPRIRTLSLCTYRLRTLQIRGDELRQHGLGVARAPFGPLGRAVVDRSLRREHPAAQPFGRLRTQPRGPLVRADRRRTPASPGAAFRGALQFGREPLVRLGRGHRLVPDPPVRILRAGERAGQRPVRGLPPRHRGRRDQSEAQQRMPEREPRPVPVRPRAVDPRPVHPQPVHPQNPGPLGHPDRLGRHPEQRRGPQQHLEFETLGRRGQLEERLDLLRQLLNLRLERVDQPLRQLGHRHPAQRLYPRTDRLGLRRQFEQRQRIAERLCQDLYTRGPGERGRAKGQHLVRVRIGKAGESECRQPGTLQRRVALPGAEDERDLLRLEPARREHQRAERGLVQPVRVVHQAQHRALRLGQFGEQGQHGQADQQLVRRLRRVLRGQAERRGQRGPLRLRQRSEPVQRRTQQQVQARVGQPGLVLVPGGPQHRDAKTGRVLLGRREQRRLADPGLPGQHQRPAAALARPVRQPFQGALLLLPPAQHVSESNQRSRHSGGRDEPRLLRRTATGRNDPRADYLFATDSVRPAAP
jgi:hypothetical protein